MESYSFYIKTEEGLREYDYKDLVYYVNNGAIDPEEKVLMVENLWRSKRYVKAKNVERMSF
jgi:hypothetical protein